MSVILQILSLLFVVLWTARLARNKGRNPLLWAGAAAIPVVGLLEIFPEWLTVLCMVPMLALVFTRTRRTVAADGEQEQTISCPRCQHAHEPGPSFCTNCGWELTRAYATADGSSETVEAAETTMAASTDTAADATASPAPDPVLASQQTTEAAAAPTAPAAEPEPDAAPAFAVAPLKITRPLTAAGMTELGLSLFNQGRVREAVDQFTKAIALDPRYREAWANRAKAYSELGLSEKAAEDRQQLEAI